MRKLLLISIVTLLFGLDLTYTKAYNNYTKGLKLLKSDPPKAQQYFKKAFELFNQLVKENKASSQTYYFLGKLYCNGEGVKKDYKKAEEYFLKALKLGNERVNCCLARLYIKMHKLSKAKEYLNKALHIPGVKMYCSDIDPKTLKIIK